MCQNAEVFALMNPSAAHGTKAASFCSHHWNERKSHCAFARVLDTMVMVSIFAILGVEETVLAVLLLLAGALLIMLARICRAEAPKRRLLSI